MGVTPTVPEKISDKSVVAWASPLMKGHNPGTNKKIEIAGVVLNLPVNLTASIRPKFNKLLASHIN